MELLNNIESLESLERLLEDFTSEKIDEFIHIGTNSFDNDFVTNITEFMEGLKSEIGTLIVDVEGKIEYLLQKAKEKNLTIVEETICGLRITRNESKEIENKLIEQKNSITDYLYSINGIINNMIWQYSMRREIETESEL